LFFIVFCLFWICSLPCLCFYLLLALCHFSSYIVVALLILVCHPLLCTTLARVVYSLVLFLFIVVHHLALLLFNVVCPFMLLLFIMVHHFALFLLAMVHCLALLLLVMVYTTPYTTTPRYGLLPCVGVACCVRCFSPG
jgi:hypothetical protein